MDVDGTDPEKQLAGTGSFVFIVFYVLFAVVRLSTLQGNVEFQSAAFVSRDSVLEEPPFGEGWDAEGNDLSKITNDVSLTVSVVPTMWRFCSVQR